MHSAFAGSKVMRRRLTKVAKQKGNSEKKPPFNAAVEKVDLQRQVFQLRLKGWSDDEIADQLSLTRMQVALLVAEAYQSRTIDRDKYAERFLTTALARYEALLKVWWPRAEGFYDLEQPLLDEFSNPLLDDDGNPRHVWIDPDLKAAKLVKEITKDACETLGLLNSQSKVKVEHSGANGGAIEFDVSLIPRLSDEQIAKIQKHPHLLRSISALGVGSREEAEDRVEEAITLTEH